MPMIQEAAALEAGIRSSSEQLSPADPQLEPLDFYGGETRTRPLLTTSPGIGVGSNPDGLSTDPRGEVRAFGTRTDTGAVEPNEQDGAASPSI